MQVFADDGTFLIVIPYVARHYFELNEKGYAAAERLLALYEPGVVVEIKSDPHEEYNECRPCDLSIDDDMTNSICTLRLDEGTCCPQKNCPGPGRYKLVRIDG